MKNGESVALYILIDITPTSPPPAILARPDVSCTLTTSGGPSARSHCYLLQTTTEVDVCKDGPQYAALAL